MTDGNYLQGPQIPGIFEFFGHRKLESGLLLLTGAFGAGKTMYCRQFIIDGLYAGDCCIYVSSSLNINQFKDLFGKIEFIDNLKFVNPCQFTASRKNIVSQLYSFLVDLKTSITKYDSIRIVVDSLTHLSRLCGEKTLFKFISDLAMLIEGHHVMGILTLSASERRFTSSLSSFTEGIIQMKLEEQAGNIIRKIRLLSIKCLCHEPVWVDFKIVENGNLVFGDKISLGSLMCVLCGKKLKNSPIVDGGLVFDTNKCMETYKKIAGVYGSSFSETGLTDIFNATFFFVDVVGLSDPLLSVRKQVQKITDLNNIIDSCDAYTKTPKDKKVILPTGDGMAIGFLLNPVLPLELCIELHRKLNFYNRCKTANDQIGVRIGLASGPVFTVTDMNGVQNLWGPGIILARRVMDAGDNGHILIADKLAEELIALKDEYRGFIKPICNLYEIKHGQTIRLYSAYSQDFGNPHMPFKVPSIQ